MSELLLKHLTPMQVRLIRGNAEAFMKQEGTTKLMPFSPLYVVALCDEIAHLQKEIEECSSGSV